jgi:hypothetical protein
LNNISKRDDNIHYRGTTRIGRKTARFILRVTASRAALRASDCQLRSDPHLDGTGSLSAMSRLSLMPWDKMPSSSTLLQFNYDFVLYHFFVKLQA